MGLRNYLKYLLIFIVIGAIGVSIYFAVRDKDTGQPQLGEDTIVQDDISTEDEISQKVVQEEESEIDIEQEVPAKEKKPGFYATDMQDHPNYSLICPEGWELLEEESGQRLSIKDQDDSSSQMFLLSIEKSSDIQDSFSEGVFESYRSNVIDQEGIDFFYDEYVDIAGSFERLSGYSYPTGLSVDGTECIDYLSTTEMDGKIYLFKYIASGVDRATARKNFLEILSDFNFEEDKETLKESSNSPSVNLLILGDDSAYDRAGGRISGRTDIIMVFHINLETYEGTIVTIPRDTWVEIPGHGEGKINGAHAIGGNELTVQTIEHFSGLKIDNYIITDFDGFIPLIDFLGGVTVEVTEDLADGFSGCYLSVGTHHLNGEQALALCRNRHRQGGAYARESEAAKVILALNQQKTTIEKVLALPFYVNFLLNYTWTDMDFEDLLRLIPVIGKIDSDDITVTSIPSWPQMVGNASAVVYDEEATADLFEEVKNQ